MLNLYDYQHDAIAELREGFAKGYKAQVLVAPTGSGKTEMAIALMEAVRAKGNRAAMVLDRIVLCNQTSGRLDKYGIDHGVLQANHWRFRPYEQIQVCSAQTLERMKEFPEIDLLIIDECHSTRTQTTEFIKANPKIKVVGLTATPFTKGLGKIYDNVVSTVTTKDLIRQEVLVPLRVFIAKEIDMAGAKTSYGEWTGKEVTARGKKVTGDIVAEWIEKTHAIFGRPRKTVVFAAGVDHGIDLSRKFQEQGYNFLCISYKDDGEYKADVIEDFSKPDTEIHGLIATDILTKGFDVPDVMIGISARPFTKSLSSHIQQLGRVTRSWPGGDKSFAVWLCMAKGSKVLTDKGLVPIDKVKLHHKIWDGTNFVNHEGAVCNGIQEVITYQGLTATAGHLVHTEEGWRTFGDCASKQIRITQTGFGGQTIQISQNIQPTSFLVGRKAQKIYSCIVRVHDMWIQKFNITIKSPERQDQRLQSLQSARANISDVAIQQSSSYEGKVPVTSMQSIYGLRGKGDRIQICWSKARNFVDNGKSWFARVFFGCRTFPYAVRQDKSKWSLRTWEPSLAFCGIESTKQERKPKCGKDAQIQNGLSRNPVFRCHIEGFLLGWDDSRTNNREIPQAINKAKREVWDILNCGQNNRFTCEGLLVHNCHSGNYMRFKDEWDDVFENGVDELDDGKEKAKQEPTEYEKEVSKCPKCHALWAKGSDTCYNCGFVREKANAVYSVNGVMEELSVKKKVYPIAVRQSFWSSMTWKMHNSGWSRGRAANTFRDKFGEWPEGLNDNLPRLPSLADDAFCRKNLYDYLNAIKKR
jgi:superfamily II DNA or RNA helicase